VPYFRISARSGSDREAYWLYASDPDEARARVARSVGEGDAAQQAQDITKYDCSPDETKTPPRRLIYRRLGGPLEVRG
jgi:hypothetical protein